MKIKTTHLKSGMIDLFLSRHYRKLSWLERLYSSMASWSKHVTFNQTSSEFSKTLKSHKSEKKPTKSKYLLRAEKDTLRVK